MKIKKFGNGLLIFTLAFLFLVPSFYPVNAQEAGSENGRCDSNEDCILGNVCSDNDIGCYCSQSICVARGAPGEECDTNRPCQAGSECFGLPGEDYCIPREEITAFTNFQNQVEGSTCPQGLGAACASLAQPQQAPAPQAPAGDGAATPPAVQQLENPLGAGADIPEIIARVIKAVLGLVGSIGLLMFIYGGFLWLTAGGSEERVKKGREVLTWAVIGLATIFTSYAILNFIISGLTRSAGQANEESGGRERRQPVRLEDFE